jgi:hypothetical protein
VNQKEALALGALAGAAAAFLLGRRRSQPSSPAPTRAPEPAPQAPPAASEEDLQAKLAEAREAAVDEAEFNAAGMAGETFVADEPRPAEPAPANEFEAMRRRVHEEARAAAEEMRRKAESPD